MSRIGIALLALATAAAVAPSADAAQGGVVSLDGRVGKVYVGKATPQRVRSAFGRPTSTRTYDNVGAGQVRSYTMRYACGRRRHSMFWFDPSGRLANFYTSCQSWRTAAGTRVGDSYEDAIDQEGKEPGANCGGGEAIHKTGRAFLGVSFARSGGRVRTLSVAGRNGVLGC